MNARCEARPELRGHLLSTGKGEIEKCAGFSGERGRKVNAFACCFWEVNALEQLIYIQNECKLRLK